MTTDAVRATVRPWPLLSRAAVTEETLCARLFWGWLAVRTVLWAVVAWLTQPNAQPDTIDFLYWGHEWCLGYCKQPPLAAWIAECFAQLTPGSLAGVCLASSLCVGCCLWAAWRLGRDLLPPRTALLAALGLEAVIYYNYDPLEFNNNVVLGAAWALGVLSFWRALRSGRWPWWCAAGLAVGLALLAKYSAVFLIAPMCLFMVASGAGRRAWMQPGPYLAGLVALLVFAPHLVWMSSQGSSPIRYGLGRATGGSSGLNHLLYPASWGLSQLVRLLPLGFVLLPLFRWRWRRRETSPEQRFGQGFLAVMVLGPVALHLLLSLVCGMRLRDVWGMPLWTYAGVLLLCGAQTSAGGPAHGRAGVRLGLVAVFFLVLAPVKNVLVPLVAEKPGAIHFPGPQLAAELTHRWQQRFGAPFALVAGDTWLAGNVSFYAPHRPSVYGSIDASFWLPEPRTSPWTNDEDFRTRGGVFVWDVERWGEQLPAGLHTRFPTLDVQPMLTLPRQTWSGTPPVRIGVAFQPPQALLRLTQQK